LPARSQLLPKLAQVAGRKWKHRLRLGVTLKLHRRHAVAEADQGRPDLTEVGRTGGDLHAGQPVANEEQSTRLPIEQLNTGLVLGQHRPLPADDLLQVASGFQPQTLVERADRRPELPVVLLAPQPQRLLAEMQRQDEEPLLLALQVTALG